MDAGTCDGLVPTQDDLNYHGYIFTNGEAHYVSYNNVSGTHLQAWKDYAWNEGKHLLEWYEDTGSGVINFLTVQQLTDNMGSHRSASDAYESGSYPIGDIDMYLAFAVVPSDYGVTYGSDIKLCVTPISAGIPGERKCSPYAPYTP